MFGVDGFMLFFVGVIVVFVFIGCIFLVFDGGECYCDIFVEFMLRLFEGVFELVLLCIVCSGFGGVVEC